jgi:hypothetical protein
VLNAKKPMEESMSREMSALNFPTGIFDSIDENDVFLHEQDALYR